ncbi:MAG: recombinase family protein, partial [Mycobacterium sp.]|uniref:recombinase family protein n=1 Tax=Mycobacterium sp. TaxID=1785 RepID=UPI003F98B3D1
MTHKNPLHAAIYARISQDRTGEQAGVDRQTAECRALADRLGWTVAGVYIDNDISAYKRKRRPRYEDLLTDIEAGRINAVIAWHPDRLHRRTVELERFIDVCEAHGTANATVQTGPWDLTTPSGRLVARQLASVGQYESEQKSARVRAEKRVAALNGKHMGGVRCFGYQGGMVADGGGMVVIESEAAEIRRIASAVVRGESLRSLALDLNQRGVPTATGKRWGSSHLRSTLLAPRLAGIR